MIEDSAEGQAPDSTNFNINTTHSHNLVNGIEYQSLDTESKNPLLIDNKEVYYQGYLALSEEDKARVLLGFLMINGDPSLTNIEDLSPRTIRERLDIGKENKLFKLKFYGLTGLLVVTAIIAVVVIGLFMYISLDKGVLDDNGVVTGVLSTLQEVFRILFTDPTSSPAF